MTAAEIIDKIKKSQPISNEIFDIEIVLDFQSIKIEDLNYRLINFTNCEFNEGLTITGIDSSDSKFLTFSNCKFKYKLSISNSSFNRVNITDCTFDGEILIRGLKIIEGEFSFKKCFAHGGVDFTDILCHSMILNHNKIDSLYLSNIESYRIKMVCLKDDINLVDIYNIDKVEHLLIENDDKIGFLKINNAKEVSLKGKFKTLQIENTQISALSLSGELRGKYENGTIEKLVLRSSVISQSLNITDFTIEELDFEDVSAVSGSISFNNLILKKTLLRSVRASKFYLDLVEFKDQLMIKTCDLSGLKPNNVTWLENKVLTPDLTQRRKKLKRKNIEFSTIEDYIIELKYQRDVYRQLKVASQNNHNQMEALAFYRNEMRLYWKEIRLVGGISKSNRFLVFLNRWMSDFGQNYWLPLMWILIFQSIFSTLIWNFEACAHCGIGTNCENDFWKGLAEYLTWINPIFKAPEDWSSGAKIISFFMRIFNGFFIYHFIKAIRKYGKGE